MTRFTCVVVGNGSLLIGCSTALLDQGHQIRAVVTADADIRDWATGLGLTVLENPEDLTQAGDFDWLFSIANLSLLSDHVLSLPQRGALNFHDGPLPRHAGLNAPAWALIEGESRYGITWHMLESGVDEGDIVAQAHFDIAEGETAYSLNSKCYAAGLESFSEVLGQLSSGAPDRQPQDLSLRSYHARNDRPQAAGFLDFGATASGLINLVNALDFGDYWNPLTCAKIRCGDTIVLVSKATSALGSGTPGTVLDADQESVTIATSDSAIRLSGLQGISGQPIEINHVMTPGSVLEILGPDTIQSLNTALRQSLAGETRARRALGRMQAAKAPLTRSTGADGSHRITPEVPDGLTPDDIVAAAIIFAVTATGEGRTDIAVSDDKMRQAANSGILAGWRPIGADPETRVSALMADVTRNLPQMRTDGAWPADLIVRDPKLHGTQQPEIALMLESDEALDGSPLTVSVTGSSVILHADAAVLDPDAAGILARRLAHILHLVADRPGDVQIGQLDVLPHSEKTQMHIDWNATAMDFDPETPVHAAFEAQVDRTPDATALVFEGAELSYATLNARANALAVRLQAAGVKPGSHVGLFVRRSFDMVVGALSILKAGGAYVPLDPTYPADRIAHYIADSRARLILTDAALKDSLPENDAKIMLIGAAPADATAVNVDGGARGADLAYLIYTSGSTGTPKGVMVRHSNVANFFAAMDHKIPHKSGDTWLAVTSLNFDISVLEIFWTLSRGFRVVLSSDESRLQLSAPDKPHSNKGMDFNLFYWGNDDGPGPRKYELLLEGAKFADKNGFNAVWTPERHFHAFGGPYPNPSVTGAAVAAVTENIGVRAGSCVGPLHHPARIAEEWAVIDNLTNGRAALGIASGWQPDDFILRPENTPPDNKPAMFETIDTLRKLWRGDEVSFPRHDGGMHAVITQPRPVSKELSLWVTTAGNPATWKEAGQIGANVLTHLLGQSIEEVGEKIELYHAALRDAGHDPAKFTVTLMLHTYLADTREEARRIAREPMKDYLRSAAGLIKQYAWAFPAFKKPKGVSNPFEMDLGSLTEDELEAILDFAFDRYFEDSGLFGTIEDAEARVDALKGIGVGEIACLIDYGIEPSVVLEGLRPLAEVLRRTNDAGRRVSDLSLAGLMRQHNVTHMQCTPSLARLIAADPAACQAAGGLEHLLLGGEALSGDLVAALSGADTAQIHNMYGPTETTIWSTMDSLHEAPAGTASLGQPVANTTVYVRSSEGKPVPIGTPGELCIGGAGVTAGYWQRPDLTKDRFPADPEASGQAQMYRTGDLVKWTSNGTLAFLGRTDHQIKIRGQRIELGEIEATLSAQPEITGAVVVQRRIGVEDKLVAYVTTYDAIDEPALRARLAVTLTDAMTPAHVIRVDEFPLTPNKKIDRSALPEPVLSTRSSPDEPAPTEGVAAQVAGIWSGILGVSGVGAGDSFFDLGGHSLLAVQAHRELRDTLNVPRLGITDIFRFPVFRDLVAHINGLSGNGAPADPEPAKQDPTEKAETMSKRRAMRAGRRNRSG